MKFVVFSLGCRVNTYEGQSMVKELELLGHEATDRLEAADCYVLNTCSVTAEADKKSRQAVARALKLNPDAKVYVCGCSSQNDPEPYLNKKNVKIVGGTSGKMELIRSIMSDIVRENEQNLPQNVVSEPPFVYEDDLYGEMTRTRGYIKIQDGCNNFCSYCIIPYLRGRSRSRALNAVVLEAEDMAKKTEEIVFTGINTSAYGKDISLELIDLVKAVSHLGVRKRFGSLECNVITEEFLLAMKNGGWCDHFHLSMQSGSSSVLKKMNRHYTAEQFIEKCDLIRSVFPDAGITTDVIVGFPTETDEEFIETMNTARRVAFSGMHVFPYSVRKGTNAAKFKQVDSAVAGARAKKLRELADRMHAEFLQNQLGKKHDVYVEEEDNGLNVGYTSNYIKVYTAAPVGSFITLSMTEICRDGLKGEIL